MPDRPQPGRESSLKDVGRAWVIGLDFFYMVIGGGLLGFGLDWVFGTRPILLLVGLGAGLVTGFTRFIREALAANKRLSDRADR